MRPTEPENYRGWQRSSNFPMLPSANDCGKFVQTTQALPSVNKIHYCLPDSSKSIDCGSSMKAWYIELVGGRGGISPHFLNFGTNCKWAVSFNRCSLHRYLLAVSWWVLEPLWICFVWFLLHIALISPHTVHQLVFVMKAQYSLWDMS